MNQFKNIAYINKGSYSRVYSALNSKNEKVAIKKIILSQKDGIPPTTIREIFLLRKLKNQHIIALKNVFMNEKEIFLIFDFCEYDLMIYIAQFPYSILCLYKQIIESICYIHKMKVIHRDLKPQNILIKDGKVKLADFGLARSIAYEDNNLSNDVVTLNYRAPELLKGLKKYSYFIDMWSIGCIFYEMVVGDVLFNCYNERQLGELIAVKNIENIRSNLKIRNLNNKLIDGIVQCLNIDFEERITAEKLKILFQ